MGHGSSRPYIRIKVSRPEEHEIFVLADRWERRHAVRAPTKGHKPKWVFPSMGVSRKIGL